MQNVVQIKTLYQHSSAQIRLFCSFPFLFNLLALNWGRANKTTLLSLIRLYFFYNGGLRNHFDNYFAEIASVHKYQTRLASLQKYYLSRMKTSLGQLSSKYIGPKSWSNIPENLKSSSPYSFGQIYKKKSCYLSRLPVDLRFICLSHSVILRWCHYFPSYLPL